MHILLFLVTVLGSVFLLPECWIVTLVKALLSGVMAYVLLRLFRR